MACLVCICMEIDTYVVQLQKAVEVSRTRLYQPPYSKRLTKNTVIKIITK